MQIVRLNAALVFLCCLSAVSGIAQAATPYSMDWLEQFGTSAWDQAYGVSADGTGNVYVTGETAGSLGGTNAGFYDAFDAKYNIQGVAQQTTQYGDTGSDVGTGISADSLGNVFVAGYSQGPLNGPNNGGFQAQLSNYTPAGTLQWSQYIGPVQTYAYGVSADGQGNAYIAGYTTGSLNQPNAGGYDAYVAKYDSTGNALWTHQFGTSAQDQALGVAADGANSVYVTGSTQGSLGGTNAGGYDAFVRKYDAAGNLQWTQQLGSAGNDIAEAVAAKSGCLYIVGNTSGSLGGTNAGLADAFISKFSSAGVLQWTKQFGTSGNDYADGVAADANGNVFVVGYTQGALGGTNVGGYDAFLSEFNAAGNLQWTQQLGSPGNDFATSVSVDGFGHVFVAGDTTGSLGGTNAGSYDAWLARFSPVPMLGDFNRDGVVDSADINAMMAALTNLSNYTTDYDLSPAQLLAIGDFNGDGVITNADLQGLLKALIDDSWQYQPVPEPASFLLLAMAGALCLWERKRRSGVFARPNPELNFLRDQSG
ncbi:MAG TPA: SBBP repeat-containing protein [Pirellulales bacterium]|nr:SBBP repeat-containing protein [Pirellulales bacterium]